MKLDHQDFFFVLTEQFWNGSKSFWFLFNGANPSWRLEESLGSLHTHQIIHTGEERERGDNESVREREREKKGRGRWKI